MYLYVSYTTFATERECLEIFKPYSQLMVEGVIPSLMINIPVVDSGLMLIDREIVVHGLMLEGALDGKLPISHPSGGGVSEKTGFKPSAPPNWYSTNSQLIQFCSMLGWSFQGE